MKTALVYMDRALDGHGLTFRHVNAEPLGVRYLAGMLKKSGCDVNIFLQGHKTLDEITSDILAVSPDVVGISCLTYNINISQRLAQKLKTSKKKPKVILGGEHPSLAPETSFTDDIDCIVQGEGELTLLEIVESISNGKSLDEIKGVFIVDNSNRILHTGNRPQADINSLPWPMRDPEAVMSTRMSSFFYPPPVKQTGLATILASRGCSFNCTYCSSHHLWGNRVRFRDVSNVVEEIDYINRELGANVVVFYDLTFNLRNSFVEELCDRITEKGLNNKLSFYSTCRVSSPNGKLLLTKKILTKMKTAGFHKIGLGIESTDDDIAESYKSGKTPWENNLLAVNYAHDLGILVRGFIIIGGPNETPTTYEKTKKRLNEIPLHDIRVGYLVPFPGTMLDKDISQEDRFSMDLSKYDCSVPVVKNSNFSYKQLIDMERDLLTSFHNSPYRKSVIADVIKRDHRFMESANWRIKDLKEKGLM